MNWFRVPQALGAICTGGGGIAIWYAFQRQMCTGAGSCAPNVAYLIPGVLAALLGLGLVKLRLLAVVSGVLAVGTFLYGVFLLVVRGETLSIGFFIFIITLVFAALAYGAETFRARRQH